MFQLEFSTLVIMLLIIAVAIIAYVNFSRMKVNAKLIVLNKKIIESEEEYKLVVDGSTNIMFIQNQGKLLFVNKQFVKMSAYSHDELKNMSLFDFVDKEYREIIQERSRLRNLGHDVPSEYEVRTINRNGKVRYFELKLNLITYKGERAILGIGTDISSKKQNLETIRKLSIAVEYSPASVIIFDKEGDIEYANAAFSKATAYNNDEVIGMNIRKLNPEDFPIVDSEGFWDIIKSGKIWEGELQSKKKSGELFWEKVSVSPIYDKDGSITHFSSVNQDIDIQKSMLLKLTESEENLKEANATKDRFFSIIAHDLKSPFNSILGYASLLLEQFAEISDSEKIEFIGNINEAAESTYNLLENILDWSRAQSGKIDFNPEKFDLWKVVNQELAINGHQAKKKNISLISKVKYKTFVYADKNMIKTVLRNLITNAIKFTEKGEVVIEAEVMNSNVMVSVIDSGVGISNKDFGKLFKIGEKVHTLGTNREKGTGLGLILSKEFIVKNGGEIWVNRMKGQGTIFNFILPIN